MTPVDGEVQIHAPERQSAAIEKVAQDRPNAVDVKMTGERRRGLERWLGELEQCSALLLDIFKYIISKTDRDPDIRIGLYHIQRIAEAMYSRIQPMAKKYQDDKDWGKRRAHELVEMLFSRDKEMSGSYEVMEVLQGVHIYLSFIKGSLRGMKPAAQALWDEELIECVKLGLENVQRMEEWTLQQMQIKAPQSLIVPVPIEGVQM